MTKNIIRTSNLKRSRKLKAFNHLLTIMDQLRENCPWDKKQTMESLRHLTIEETYELSDAILEGDLEKIEKELGDLMLHLTFYARLGSEKKAFDMETVLNGICDKLIRRHPHIYSNTIAKDEAPAQAAMRTLRSLNGLVFERKGKVIEVVLNKNREITDNHLAWLIDLPDLTDVSLENTAI